MLSFDREEPEPDFLPVQVNSIDSEITSCIDESMTSSFRRIPREIHLRLNTNDETECLNHEKCDIKMDIQ